MCTFYILYLTHTLYIATVEGFLVEMFCTLYVCTAVRIPLNYEMRLPLGASRGGEPTGDKVSLFLPFVPSEPGILTCSIFKFSSFSTDLLR